MTDTTALARRVVGAVAANVAFDIEVRRAIDAAAEVTLSDGVPWARVGGALHGSGLMALVDATGLAAIVAAVESEDELTGFSALGRAAELEFLAPAAGPLLGRCALTPADRAAVRPLLAGTVPKARVSTAVEILDEHERTVCRGTFAWRLRRA